MSLTVSCSRHHSNSKNSDRTSLGLELSLSHTLPYLGIAIIFETIHPSDLLKKVL